MRFLETFVLKLFMFIYIFFSASSLLIENPLSTFICKIRRVKTLLVCNSSEKFGILSNAVSTNPLTVGLISD